MRFRATIVSNSLLPGLLQTLAKAGTSCILVMSETEWQFKMVGDASGESFSNFATLKVASNFLDYTCESKNNNEICLQIEIASFEHAMRAFVDESGTIRLSKKGTQPIFIISAQSITQEIPVESVNHNQMGRYVEPAVGAPDIKLQLPPLKTFRPLIERLKSIAPQIEIELVSTGTAEFTVRTDLVTVHAFHQNLLLPGDNTSAALPVPIHNTAKIDAKKFAKVLALTVLKPTQVLACIVAKHAFIVHAVLADHQSLTYYIPLINDEDAPVVGE